MVPKRSGSRLLRITVLPGGHRPVSYPTCSMSWTGSTSPADTAERLTLVRRELQRRDPHRGRPRSCGSPHRRTPQAPRSPVRASSPAPHRLRSAPRALRQLYEPDNSDGANQAPGRFADLYATAQTPRIPRSRRHQHRLPRRKPRLPHHQTRLQRTPRRNQQPPPWSYDASYTGSPTTATTQPVQSSQHDPNTDRHPHMNAHAQP